MALDSFRIDRTEVTNAQYQRCVEAEECEVPEVWCGAFRDAVRTSHPVVCVDWSMADAYCEWAEARLPTEAEWEYAVRAPNSLKYPWGDREPDDSLLNFEGDVGDTTEVGSYPGGASWCGALDMSGNVFECVAAHGSSGRAMCAAVPAAATPPMLGSAASAFVAPGVLTRHRPRVYLRYLPTVPCYV